MTGKDLIIFALLAYGMLTISCCIAYCMIFFENLKYHLKNNIPFWIYCISGFIALIYGLIMSAN